MRAIVCSTVCLFFWVSVLAQTMTQGGQITSPTITVVAASDRLRITAPASIVQMRVEIYDGNGIKVWDSEIHGNVFDWHVQDGQAQRLAAADYACVVTVKNVAGRVSQKVGSIAVGERDVRVERVETRPLTSPQSQAIGPVEEDASWTIVAEEENQTTTVIAHDGTDGQIIRGRGAFSFRLGDFFFGKDKEQMRLSEEGNLGIGTAKPEFKLDVAGAIRAREGFVFNDGSTLTVNEKGVLTRTTSDGSVTANIVGAGTQGRLAKWTDNAGTVGDSVVVESSGNIGIGVSQPGDLLDIAGPPNGVGRSGIHVRTTSSSGNATLYFDNDRGNFSAYGGLLTGGSVNANAFFGVTRADKTFLIADGPASLGLGVGTLTPQPLLFGTSNTERMRINSIGNVGVGTNDPQQTLHVNGLEILSTGPGAGFKFRNRGSSSIADDWVWYSNANVARFWRSGFGDIIGVTQSGNVGIGTTAPAARLHVVGATPPPVSVGNGTNASPVLKITGGNGGDTTDPNNNFFRGGVGGGIITQAGNGGNYSVASGRGGDGGEVTTQSGDGGMGDILGGTGGSVRLQAGAGGPPSGDGGSITLQAGAGIAGFFHNGSGGSITLQAGAGPTPNLNGSIRLQGGPVQIDSHLSIVGNAGVGGNGYFLGTVGIGTGFPNAKLHVVGGDAAITTQGNGLILRAVDGPLCFRLIVFNAGTLFAIPVGCP